MDSPRRWQLSPPGGRRCGTPYRQSLDRDALFTELTHRSFEQVLHNADTAEIGDVADRELCCFIRAGGARWAVGLIP